MDTAAACAADFPDARKAHVFARLFAERYGRPIRRLLVVGCGSGIEAAVIARELGCEVIGIDLLDAFDRAAARVATLQRADATALPFADASFDFVYSYHALEHIPDVRRALFEMDRVLKARGGYCIGTPNRSRLIGYLGSEQATFAEKIRWNLADWRARAAGRFRNECGAHAGFTRLELAAALRAAFGDVHDLTLEYYRAVYASRRVIVSALARSGAGSHLFPSIYFDGVAALPRRGA